MEEEDLSTDGTNLIRVKDTEEARKLLTSAGPLLLVVYAKWCGHCQSMFETWRKLSNRVKAKVYVIEASDYTDKDIQGYPDMRIVKKGKSKKYEGGRTIKDLENALLGGKRIGTRRFRNRVRKTTHRTFRRNMSLV